MLDWKQLPRPIVALAPMADMTDLPFCLICKEHGAPLVFREMVSSEAVVRGNAKTLDMAKFDEAERPIIQQIFGSNPFVMAEAANIIEERYHPDGIDINMGCPVYNIVSNFNGASLIRDHDRAAAIVRAVKKAVSIPVSVKTRLGWSRDTDCLEFVKVIEDAGADLISMHGRTKEQGYSGKADWKSVGKARARTSLPFLVNGDIVNVETARSALAESGADGMLIGRGALGNPWFFCEIRAAFDGTISFTKPTIEERVKVALRHAKLHAERYGERGLVKLRKHLPYYFKKDLKSDYPWIDIMELRAKLVRISTLEELEAVLRDLPYSAPRE